MPGRMLPLGLALGTLALTAGGAAAATAPARIPLYGLPPGPSGPPAPANLGVRLPSAATMPGFTLGGASALNSPANLLGIVLLDPRRRTEAVRRLRRAGFIGGVTRDYLPSAGPAALGVRAWAIRLGTPGGASYALGAVSWALRAGAPPRTTKTADVDGLARALLVQAPATGDGSPATTLLFTDGSWLFGLRAAAPLNRAGALTGIAMALEAAQPPETSRPGAARALAPTASLRAALAGARARPRGTRAVAPLDGTVQAAMLGTVGWAVARFPGAGLDPVVFRQNGDGPWIALGDPGGPGCPRLPAGARAIFGLGPACPAGASAVTRPDDPDALPDGASAFAGIGSWIWYVGKVGGVGAIVAQAKARGIRTVFVKAADGVRPWAQWRRSVGPLRAAGLRVCAWQYAYPSRPETQAAVAARAIARGADCFVVDAEAEWEGGRYEGAKYRAARRYMRALRRAVGSRVPIGLTSFPYVLHHRTFPYSAFLEPPWGADVNMPQIYWGAFRTDVASAMRKTYTWNDEYGVPTMPIAGTFRRERPADLLRFRCLAAAYGSVGASYWSWQDTRPSQWPVLGVSTDCTGVSPIPLPYLTLERGAKGDPVVWLQARLRAWGLPVARDGHFGAATRAAVAAFQRQEGLPAIGRADAATWRTLLQPPDAGRATAASRG
jgi:putative peptidoglycan binding protein